MIRQVGLTGGIGSGKTTVAAIFQSMGYLIYFADDRARDLTNNDKGINEALKSQFGEDVFTVKGMLDRKKLAAIVFKDKKQLGILNGIIHPVLFQDYQDWLTGIPSDYARKFVLKEAAILFESGSYVKSDTIISIYAPKTIRINRVMQRDNADEQSILDRMKNQWKEEVKIKKSHYAIYNDGEHMLIPQVKAVIDGLAQRYS